MNAENSDISVEKLASFWENARLNYIIPNTGSEFPEGFEVFQALGQMIPPEKDVVEIGCGYGRLCTAFAAENYKGFDLISAAIRHGKQRFPNYSLSLIKPWEPLPKADITLAYCTAFHIPDNERARFLKLLSNSSDSVVFEKFFY